MTADVPDQVAKARQQLLDLTNAYWQTQAVYVLAKLGIPDLLAEGPRNVQQLAAHAHAHAPSLGRLLRAVASLGLVSEAEPGMYANTARGNLLRQDVPGSLRYLVLMNGADWHWRPWEQLAYSVQTGNPAFDRTFGMGAFEFFAAQAEAGEIFNGCMTNYSHMEMTAITSAYDFTAFQRIVDIAGGHGSLLAAILRQATKARGVLFDLPEVIAGAREHVLREGMQDRCELVEGSFFESVPSGDLLMMKHIIHDWDDVHACQILQHCRRSIADAGTLLLFEMVVPKNTAEPHPSCFLDIEMLVMTRGGRERTEAEFALLLADCGFKLTRIVPTHAPVCVIEAKPV